MSLVINDTAYVTSLFCVVWVYVEKGGVIGWDGYSHVNV